MKKNLIFLIAVLFALFSCQQEEQNTLAGEAELVVSAELPQAISSIGSRAAITASNKGGFDNVDWATYQLRYILEIYNESGTCVKREVKYKTSNESGAAKNEIFVVRLVPGKTYNVVMWADFINQGSEDDLYYTTNGDGGLTDIAMKTDTYVGNDDSRDAYFANKSVLLTAATTENIVLKRPFGKVRVITTDADQLQPHTVDNITVSYTTDLHTGFNAATGDLNAGKIQSVTYASTVSAQGNEGTGANAGNLTVAFDYIFAPKNPTQESYVFSVVVKDGATPIDSYDFTTGIPVERNKLTTVKGNLFTNQLNINVDIDDEFEGNQDIDAGKDTPDVPQKTPQFQVTVTDGQNVSVSENPSVDGTNDYTVSIPATISSLSFSVNTNIGLVVELPAGVTSDEELTFEPTENAEIKVFTLNLGINSSNTDDRVLEVIMKSKDEDPASKSLKYTVTQAKAIRQPVTFEKHQKASELSDWDTSDLSSGGKYLFQWGSSDAYNSSTYSVVPASWVTRPRGWNDAQGPCPSGYHVANEADFESIFKTASNGTYREIGSKKYFISTTNSPYKVTYYEVDEYGDRLAEGENGVLTFSGHGTLAPNNRNTYTAPTRLVYYSYPYYWVYKSGASVLIDASYGFSTLSMQSQSASSQYHNAMSVRCVRN